MRVVSMAQKLIGLIIMQFCLALLLMNLTRYTYSIVVKVLILFFLAFGVMGLFMLEMYLRSQSSMLLVM